MADFPATRRAEWPRLTDTERWEVVMQHEGPIVLSFQRINALLILCGAQRHDCETLRFPSGE